MKRILPIWLLAAWGAFPQEVDFNRQVRPILSDKCYPCHGPDAGNRKAGLRLDVEAGAKSVLPGKRAALVPRDRAKSELWHRINSDHKVMRMPPQYAGHAKLIEGEIAVLGRWIDQGAPWQKHWSFLPPRRPPAPALPGNTWGDNPIDSFVLARHQREGLKPAQPANKATLLRRVTLDLTGLPPSRAELQAFLEDQAPGAYERVVDRLLASPRHAELMAVRWLEPARYSDTNGYQSDGVRDMWRWRDWVIDAFLTNMPFDRFTVEQLAGDLLPSATRGQKIASGFNRNHRTNAEGGIVEEEFRVEYVADRAETTATVWLGLTMGCARCHDHKYDPLTQKEFYQFFAFFNNVPERGLVYNFGNEEPFIKAPTPEMEARLAALDRSLAKADADWSALQPQLRQAAARWEKSLRTSPVIDWSNRRGLVLPPEPLPSEFDLSVAKFDYLDPFTIAARINPSSPNGAIVSRAEDYMEGEGYTLYVLDGKLRLNITRRYTDISLRVETAQNLKLNSWQHILVSYDGKRKGAGVRMYVDGQPQKLNVLFDELTYPFDGKQPFRIGAGGGEKYRFRGSIDRVRVWNRALTPEEAQAVPVQESLTAIAAIPGAQRTAGQQSKMHLAFLDRFAPLRFREAKRSLGEARRQRDTFDESIPTVMVMKESASPRDTFLLKRGAYDAPGEKVQAGVPSILPELPEGAPRNRLGLARWLVDPAHPLTARVAVNRLWQMHFGTGLVKTAEDFGSQGEWPTHPELLDWLAVEFIESGWDLRHMQKLIVTSATYRQASRVTPDLQARDPENRLLARGPRRRLPADVIRDGALFLSGLLVEKVGGPSVKPYQPAGLWQELAGGKGYQADSGDGLYRRSLYTYWKRTIAPPSLVVFDAPVRETCTVRESRTNTPLQALTLMNDVTYVEASRKLAERMMQEGGRTAKERLAFAWQLALARNPTSDEMQALLEAHTKFEASYRAAPDAAASLLSQGSSKIGARLDPIALAAYTGVASLILNLDETITKE